MLPKLSEKTPWLRPPCPAARHPAGLLRTSALVLALLVSGCANSIVTTPAAITPFPAASSQKLNCRVIYAGNPEYLPQSVANCNATAAGVSAEYAYEIVYNGTKAQNELLAVFIPTTLIGTPTGRDTLVAVSALRIFDTAGDIKTYGSTSQITFYRGLFSGAVNFTEMRRRALLENKKSIEWQMSQDAELINSLNCRKGGEP